MEFEDYWRVWFVGRTERSEKESLAMAGAVWSKHGGDEVERGMESYPVAECHVVVRMRVVLNCCMRWESENNTAADESNPSTESMYIYQWPDEVGRKVRVAGNDPAGRLSRRGSTYCKREGVHKNGTMQRSAVLSATTPPRPRRRPISMFTCPLLGNTDGTVAVRKCLGVHFLVKHIGRQMRWENCQGDDRQEANRMCSVRLKDHVIYSRLNAAMFYN
ncbi:hypothetical protein ACLOJK_010006 [Asimina triloba]